MSRLAFTLGLLLTTSVICFRIQKLWTRGALSSLKMDPSVQEHANVLLDTAASPHLLSSGASTFEMDHLVSLLYQMDFHKYMFMFPVAILVSSLAISAGIGGAALFAPILLIVFPLLGPEYPLQSSAASVTTAILVETFGFSSGLYGYAHRNLIDFQTALLFMVISVPTAICAASQLTLNPYTLKCVYTALMLSLSYFLLKGQSQPSSSAMKDVPREEKEKEGKEDFVLMLDSDNKEYTFSRQGLVSTSTILSTIVGASLTGVLGVGIGEVVLPQLLRKAYPVAIAAASSTMIVTCTALSSAVIQLHQLIVVNGGGIDAIPFNLICYMIPGVLIGGQIASRMQGRLQQTTLERAIGVLFGLIGVAFATILYEQGI